MSAADVLEVVNDLCPDILPWTSLQRFGFKQRPAGEYPNKVKVSAKDPADDIISDTTDGITEMPELHFSMKDTTPADLTAVQEENESLNSALRLTEELAKLIKERNLH